VLFRLIQRGNRIVATATALAIVLPLVVIVWEVGMRYLFGAPTLWAHLTATGLIAAIFVFGGILAYQDDEHVGLAVHQRLFPNAWQPALALLRDMVVLVFLAVLAFALIEQARRSVAIWETTGSAWRAPVPMLIKVAMAAGTTLFALDVAARIAIRLRRGPQMPPRDAPMG
jgi:TRAP-type C4-dicarboxylate transport system permease small subunit